MTYTIAIYRRAQKELLALPQMFYVQVRDAIRMLAEDPHPRESKRLVGRSAWRIRIGPYRVVYEIDGVRHVVTVIHIGHRREVYRSLGTRGH